MPYKTLLLLRHAKSSWKNPQWADHDRPLNSRGRLAAQRMGRLLSDEGLTPDLVLCSTALRARETAELVFANSVTHATILYREDLYHAEPAQLSRILAEVSEPVPRLLLIGHNPGLEQFLSQLTTASCSFPTAGLAQIQLELPAWSQFHPTTRGELIQFWRPRELDSDR
jgi:phosphohistidine phosphatase